MRGKGLLAAIAGVLVLALVGVGCGGSDGGSSGASDGGSGESGEAAPVAESSVSKAQYVKKAEAVCKKGSEELEADFGAFVKESGNPQKPSEAIFVELLETVVAPNISAEVEELRELEVPEGDAEKVETMLEAREESIAIAEGEPRAVIQNPEKVFGEASKLASEYGLKACATR